MRAEVEAVQRKCGKTIYTEYIRTHVGVGAGRVSVERVAKHVRGCLTPAAFMSTFVVVDAIVGKEVRQQKWVRSKNSGEN